MRDFLQSFYKRNWSGLALVSICAAVGYALSTLPYFDKFGTLVLALIAGIFVSNVVRVDGELHERYKSGIKFSSKNLLELGVVLLGMRLNFLIIAELGLTFAVANILVIIIGLISLELIGRRFGLSPSLRRSIGVGTSICGSSAIAAAIPILKPTDEETGVSITVVNLLGTFGVFLYITILQFYTPSEVLFGALAGTTLQSVGQVIAAGYSYSQEAGDIALVVKLMRVAMLVPVLIVLSILTRKSTQKTSEKTDKRPPILPWFLIGFLLVGVANTFLAIPESITNIIVQFSLAFTALAMAAIGLGVNLSIFGKLGSRSIMASMVGFIAMISFVLLYSSFLIEPSGSQVVTAGFGMPNQEFNLDNQTAFANDFELTQDFGLTQANTSGFVANTTIDANRFQNANQIPLRNLGNSAITRNTIIGQDNRIFTNNFDTNAPTNQIDFGGNTLPPNRPLRNLGSGN